MFTKIKICCLTIFFLLISTIVFSQQRVIDSLIKSLPLSAAPDSNRLKKLVKIAGNLVFSDPEKSDFYIKEALDLTKKVKNPYWNAWAFQTFAELEERKGNFQTSIKYRTMAVHLFDSTNNKLNAARSEYGLGTSYLNVGNYNEGLIHIINSEKTFRSLNNLEEASNSMIVKASIYSSRGQYDLQIKELLTCLDIKRSIQDSNGLVSVYCELAIPMIGKNKLDTAEKYINEALTILKYQPNPFYLKSCFGNLGYIFKLRKNYAKALDLYNQSLAISNEFDDKKGICESNNKIAEIYFETNDASNCILHANKALEISKLNIDLQEQKSSYELLSKAFELKKDFKNALIYHKQFKQIEDSLLNEANMKSLNDINVKYETEKKETENQLLQTQNQLSNSTIKQQKITGYFIIGGLVLTLFLAFFIFKGLKNQRAANKIISHQKELVEEKHKEITDSINYAERIQRSFLATDELLNKHLKNYFVLFQPKDVVSGDFYWAATIQDSKQIEIDSLTANKENLKSNISNHKFILVTADSTGHGVPGAIMSILNISSLEKAVESGLTEPSEILNHTRKTIIDRLKKDGSAEGGKDGMDASLVCFDFENMSMKYAAANNPIWVVRGSELIELNPDKMPVGKHDKDQTPFTQKEITLHKGDLVYTLTDGLPDQFGGPKGKKFMYKQLKELLIANASLEMNEQKQALQNALINWKQNLEQVDDITLIGIKV